MSEFTAGEIQQAQLVFSMAAADDLMQHLDRTWWLGADVDARLAALRGHLLTAVATLDAYEAARADAAKAAP